MNAWRCLASLSLASVLAGCALLSHHIDSTVAPESGADTPQLRLTCGASSTGHCYFRYRDAVTGVRTEFVVDAGQYRVVPDISAPAKLCIWTSSVSGACFIGEHDVGPRGLFTVTLKL